MTEEQIAEYQSDLEKYVQQHNSLVQQRVELTTQIAQVRGSIGYIQSKLNPQQTEEAEIEQVTIEENEDNTEGA